MKPRPNAKIMPIHQHIAFMGNPIQAIANHERDVVEETLASATFSILLARQETKGFKGRALKAEKLLRDIQDLIEGVE